MDDDQKDLIKIGAEAALKPFSDLINQLFGEALSELGGIWKDSLAARRLIRRVRLLKHVQATIEEAGFTPKQIEDKIWVPVLQEAALQDDETIAHMWANLLANAANPVQETAVLPIFTAILKELGPNDAVFLGDFYDAMNTTSYGPLGCSYLDLEQFYPHRNQDDVNSKKIPSLPLLITLQTLEKAGLLLKNFAAPVQDETSPVRDQVPLYQGYWISALGKAFVEACRRPHK
jgi:hypothetical protein